MSGTVLLSTAYLPPAEYLALIARYDAAVIEGEENYQKQTFRNRCYIDTPNGIMALSVPVLEGSFRKIPLKEIRIDYSKRWQPVHLRALEAAYRKSPYFEFYFDDIKDHIERGYEYLRELNIELLRFLLKETGIERPLSWSEIFTPGIGDPNDYRYTLTPKKPSTYNIKNYRHVKTDGGSISPLLSSLDLLFNAGPGSASYL